MKNGYNAQHRVKGQLRQNCISAHTRLSLSILLLQTARGPIYYFGHTFGVKKENEDALSVIYGTFWQI